MRLFVAVKVLSEVKRELVRLQGLLPAGVKLVKDFHLTLRFLGEIANVAVVKEKLSGVKFSKFELCLSEVGTFSDKVVWVGLKGGVSKLVGEVERVLGKSDKEFHPHITLCRVKGCGVKLGEIEVRPLCFTVDRFYLIKSVLTPLGSEYEDVVSFEAVE